MASSREKVAATEADMTVYAQRALIDAKTLIAEGRVDAAQTLLVATLQKNPDAEEARQLLDAQTTALLTRDGGPDRAAPTIPQDPFARPTEVAKPVAAEGDEGLETELVGPPEPPARSRRPVLWLGAAAVPGGRQRCV